MNAEEREIYLKRLTLSQEERDAMVRNQFEEFVKKYIPKEVEAGLEGYGKLGRAYAYVADPDGNKRVDVK